MQYRDFTDKCYSIVWKFDKNVKNIEEDFYNMSVETVGSHVYLRQFVSQSFMNYFI